jgi:gliding motility-associated-like protein
MDSTTGNVIITSYYTFYIPNSFTPALNGLNNFFQPYGTGITDFSMNIFDRWGELIFSSTNIDQPWDGKVNGSIAPEGTYVYEINIKDNTQTAHEYVGKLNLIR